MKLLSLDIECTNESKLFSPFSDDVLLTVAGFDGKKKYFWNINHQGAPVDDTDDLWNMLQDKDTLLISHNLKMDMLWLQTYFERLNILDYKPIQAKQLLCTMIAADIMQLIERHLGEKNNLETLTVKLTGRELWKGKVNVSKLASEPFEDVKEYNITDAVNAWYTGREILKRLATKKFTKEKVLIDFEMKNLREILGMEEIGVLVDKPAIYKAGIETYTKIQELQKKVNKLVGQEVYIESNKELPRILYEELKMPVLMETPTGNPATDVPAIDELLWHIKANKLTNNWKEILLAIKDYRKESKLWSTFISQLPEYAKIDGRIHAKFNLGKGYGLDPKHEFGAGTGRLSSSDPNLQNQPNKNLIRNIFIAGLNNILLEADYSQIELCVAAELANEENMLAALRADKDLHTNTLAMVEGISYEECFHILHTPDHDYFLIYKNKRWMIKRVGFGILYGIGIDKLRRVFRLIDVDYSFNETKRFIEQWFDLYPSIRKYISSTQEEANTFGYVTTPTGRRIMTPYAKEQKDKQLIARNHRQAVNGKIQSFASDICKIAMLLTGTKYPKILRTQVHDSLLLEHPRKTTNGELIDIKPNIRKIMTTDTKRFLKDTFNVHLKVPLKVEFKQSRMWMAS